MKLMRRINGKAFPARHVVSNQEIFEKLATLEEIESKLGIELDILYRARICGIYFRNLAYGEHSKIYKQNFGYNYFIAGFSADRKCCFFRIETEENNSLKIYFDDYGKSWALTKEELL